MNTQEVLLSRHTPPIRLKLIQTNEPDVLLSLRSLFDEAGNQPDFPVKMTCFVPSGKIRETIRHALRVDKDLSTLPVTIVVQPPLGAYTVLLVLWYITEIPAKKTYHNNGLAVELKNGNQWLFFGQDMNGGETGFENSVERALTSLFTTLSHFDYTYQDLVHTWFFIPQITGISNQTERYQIFNKYRKEIFLEQSGGPGPVTFFPASTGIGCENTAVRASAVAFKSDNAVSARMMDNERQVPAYHYPEQESIEPPLFSRGMCLHFENTMLVFVSGTASILNAQTVNKNDVAGQTRQTIKNIDGLLAQHAAEYLPASSVPVRNSIKYATVYIKYAQDYLAVKDICCSYFGDIPTSYVKADVCRDNLLVEIECIACMNINQGGDDG